MRDRGILLLLLAGALTFVASLLMPWNWSVRGASGFEGFATEPGTIAALIALALAAATVASLVRPALATRLPILSLAVALAYFTPGVALLARNQGQGFFVSGLSHWDYGVWVGIAAGALSLLCALVLRRRDLARRPTPAQVVEAVLGLGVLAAFLLPWVGTPGFGGIPGLIQPAATIAALVLLVGARWMPNRLLTAIAVATLVGGAASANLERDPLRVGAWIGIGCAVALVAVEAARSRPFRIPRTALGWPALRTASAFMLVVTLFLPWLSFDHAQLAAIDGWAELPTAAAGGLALLLLAMPDLPLVGEVVVAIAFLVGWAGAIEATYGAAGLSAAYGSYPGFAATALLAVATLAQLSLPRIDPSRLLPLAAAVLSLGAVVVPTWNVLSEQWGFEANAVTGWLVVAGLLVTLYLIRAWTSGGRKTLAALALLALPTLQLVDKRGTIGMDWGGWILVGLSLLLVVLGWIEEHGGGLESFSELFRVDRIPAPEN